MASVTKLKQEMIFNGQLAGLLDAMKSIAAQQFQALERLLQSNPVLFEAIETIAATFELSRISHPFTKSEGPVGVIAITSDTGLVGGLNHQVILRAIQEYRRQPGELMVVGERGINYVREHGFSCRSFASATDDQRRQRAEEVRTYALDRVLAGQLGALSIVYPRALSFAVQRIEVVHVLPCSAWLHTGEAPPIRSGPVLMESSVSSVLEYLVWLWLGQTLVDVLGMSRLAEFSARSIHLDGSAQELRRRGKKLQLRYFKERREVIDRNMRELFSAKAIYGQHQDEGECLTNATAH